jgi:peptidoglycan/LPS O-acetylase OafA/YrhL
VRAHAPALAPPPGHPKFPALDAMRGIAAILVFVTHATVLLDIKPALLGWILPHLADLGVALFFALSGFLLYRPFAADRLGGPAAPTMGAFARNRVLRILPAYWVVLTVLLLYTGPDGVRADHPWIYYGLFQVLSESWAFQGVKPAWTLSVECAFYVLLPLYVVAAERLYRRYGLRAEWSLLAAIAAGSLGATVWVYLIRDHWLIALQTLLGYADYFAVGLVLAVVSVLMHHRSAPSRLVRFAAVASRRPSLCWLSALAVFVCMCLVLRLPGDLGYPPSYSTGEGIARHVLIGVVALGLLMPAVYGPETGVVAKRILRAPVLRWYGLVAYGLYLWHLPVLVWIAAHQAQERPDLTRLALVAVAFVASTAFAAASYYVVERPFYRLKSGAETNRSRRRLQAAHGPRIAVDQERHGSRR